MKEIGKKIGKVKPVLPAVLAAAVVAGALSGYEAPAYEVKAASKTTAQQNMEADSSKQTQAVGNFDLEDGTYEGTGTGYGGEIKVAVEIRDKSIQNIEILSAPGEDAPFFTRAQGVIDSMIQNQSVDVDVVSGATFSSRGIISAVKNALFGEKDDAQVQKTAASGSIEVKEIEEAAAYKDGVYTGTGTGFGGKIRVQVTIRDGVMDQIAVLEAAGEDEPYFSRAKGLLDTIVKKQTTNVDTVSGATYSSKGLIEAVRNALSKAAVNPKDVSEAEETKSDDTADTSQKTEVTVEKVEETGIYKDGTYTGTGEGFGGTIKVQVKIEKGKIAAVKVLDASSEDEEYFVKAKKLLDTIVKQQTTNVDVISGATYSSRGLIEAVRNALRQAVITDQEDTEKEDTKNENTAVTPTPVTGKFPYPDGTYQGSAEGYNGAITVELVIKDQTLQSAVLIHTEDDEPFITRASAILKEIVTGQTTDVDVVSGATFSSEGILGAVKNALAAASGETGEDTDDAEEEQPAETTGTAYTITTTCYPDEYWDFDKYTLALTVTIQNNKIIDIADVYEVNAANTKNKKYITKAVNGLVPQIVEKGVPDGVDIVSGATCTSDAIIEGCKSALEKAK